MADIKATPIRNDPAVTQALLKSGAWGANIMQRYPTYAQDQNIWSAGYKVNPATGGYEKDPLWWAVEDARNNARAIAKRESSPRWAERQNAEQAHTWQTQYENLLRDTQRSGPPSVRAAANAALAVYGSVNPYARAKGGQPPPPPQTRASEKAALEAYLANPSAAYTTATGAWQTARDAYNASLPAPTGAPTTATPPLPGSTFGEVDQTPWAGAAGTVGNPGSQNALLTGLYRQNYGREPDQAGFDYWNNQMKTGATNFNAMQDAFQATPEAVFHGGSHSATAGTWGDTASQNALYGLYQQNFGRDPDQAGFDYWNNQMKTGATDWNSMQGSFQNAPDAQARRTEGMNTGLTDWNPGTNNFQNWKP